MEGALADLKQHGQRVVAARGGMGGKGNSRFKSSTFQHRVSPKRVSRARNDLLNWKLKLLQRLAGRVSKRRQIDAAVEGIRCEAEIANYPFTTLAPNLGSSVLAQRETSSLPISPGSSKGRMRALGWGTTF